MERPQEVADQFHPEPGWGFCQGHFTPTSQTVVNCQGQLCEHVRCSHVPAGLSLPFCPDHPQHLPVDLDILGWISSV